MDGDANIDEEKGLEQEDKLAEELPLGVVEQGRRRLEYPFDNEPFVIDRVDVGHPDAKGQCGNGTAETKPLVDAIDDEDKGRGGQDRVLDMTDLLEKIRPDDGGDEADHTGEDEGGQDVANHLSHMHRSRLDCL